MSSSISSRVIERSFILATIRNLLAFIFVFGLLYGMIAIVYATKTIFKVKKNYAVVIEQLDGDRQAITEVGWHFRLPYFTKIEQEVPLMNQNLFLGGKIEPMRIISKENVALWSSAMLTYRIRDLKTWAIENHQVQILLQGDYDGIVKDILQSQGVDQLISDRERIKQVIFDTLKSHPINEKGLNLEEKYGIEVVSFVLKETRFGDKLVEATEEKKRRELIAEAENYAADQEASRIRKLYTAYLESITALQQALGTKDQASNQALFQFLVQQKWASAYEKKSNEQQTFVIQNSQVSPGINLPLPQGKKPVVESKE